MERQQPERETKETAERVKNDGLGRRGNNNEENLFSWDEWTVIENGQDSENTKGLDTNVSCHSDVVSVDTSSASHSEITGCDDVEEAQEADQVSLKKIEELCQSEITNASSIDLNDESDGVSVLSESESDDLARDNHKQVDDKIALCRRRVDIDTIKKAELQTTCNDESSVSSLKVFNVIAACVLALSIGLVALRFLPSFTNDHENQYPTLKESDIMTAKFETNKLLNQMKEFTGVKKVLDEVKSKKSQENSEPNNLSTKDDKNDVNKRFRYLLGTICLAVNDDPESLETEACEKQFSLLTDLTITQKLLKNRIVEIDTDAERSIHERFLNNLDFELESMRYSIVSDLTQFLDKLTMKNDKKLNKISCKLNDRLSLLRNTLPSDSKFRVTLEKNNIFSKIKCGKKLGQEKKKKVSENLPPSSIPTKQEQYGQKNKTEKYLRSNLNKTKQRDESFIKRNSQNASTETKGNSWEKRKCRYNEEKIAFGQREGFRKEEPIDATRGTLLAPPPCHLWKTKHRSGRSSSGMSKNERERTNEKTNKASSSTEDKWPAPENKPQSKGDRGASKMLKRKNAGVISDSERDTAHKVRTNSNVKHKDVKYPIPPNPMTNRIKKREVIVENGGKRSETPSGKVQGNGHWQFERSRIRNELRTDESSDNWYFSRMGNRKNSRLNYNCDSPHDSQCTGGGH